MRRKDLKSPATPVWAPAWECPTGPASYDVAIELYETRWTQSGQVRLNTGEIILYSGHEEEDSHTEGVTLMLSQEAHNALSLARKQRNQSQHISFKTKKEMEKNT